MKKLLILPLLLVISLVGQAQENKIDSLLNDLLFEDESFLDLLTKTQKYEFLYTSANYRSNTFFAGREIGVNDYNLASQISYINSNGLSIGVSGVMYEGLTPQYNTTILSAGYSKALKSLPSLRFKVSYDKYFFADIDSLESSFHSSLNLSTSYRYKNVRSRLAYSFLLGSDPSQQFTWTTSTTIDIWKKSTLKKVRFEPAIAMFIGNETEVSTVFVNNGFPGRFRPRNISEEVVYSEKFGLMNTQLQLPVRMTWRDFDLEVGYNINLPRSLAGESIDPSGYFNLSVGYLIDLKK